MLAQKYVENGVAVEFSASAVNAPSAALRENSDISFRFRVSEAASGNPIGSRRLAAWIDPAGSLASEASCQEKVKGFLEGSFFYRPAADLNSYYVLTLNREPSISVVDPLVSYGETHELTTVTLPSPGIDWAIDTRHSRVLVAMPEAKKIAVVDTANWKLNRVLDVPGRPGRVIFQPDSQYFWVAWDADGAGAESGVAVYNSATLAIAARIVTGRGAHELAFTGDSRFALVTNQDGGDVATISVQKLAVVQREHTGSQPVSIAFSTLSGMAYVSNRGDGSITAIGVGTGAKTVAIPADPGIGPIRFSPGGRLGFALNTAKDLVYIIDAAVNRIVQTGDVEKGPDQIVFSNEIAYIRHRGSETVFMIPLAGAGQPGSAVHIADFPAGQHPLGAGGRPSLADGIAQAPGENAVWVANPSDRMIYYYMEGMAAPKGSFVLAEEPRAVMVVDRSLQQTSPGVYETIARLPSAGKYAVAMLLDNPQTIHCFDLSVEADPARLPLSRRSVDVQLLEEGAKRSAGATSRIRLRFLDSATGAPRTDLKDVRVLTYLPPGLQDRLEAKSAGDGVYEIEFRPPEPGIYGVFVDCPSLNLTYSSLPGWRLEVYEATGRKQP
jgi:DNA-binding beta-propeller fold protein YncE